MNRVLIVTCDLGNPQRNYEDVHRLIKSYPGWARIGGSSRRQPRSATTWLPF